MGVSGRGVPSCPLVLGGSSILFLLLSLSPSVGASLQTPSTSPAGSATIQEVPPEFQDLYDELEGAVDAFKSRLDSQWDGTLHSVAFSTQLMGASSSKGTALLSPDSEFAVSLELERLSALGMHAVTFHLDFPLLFLPYHEAYLDPALSSQDSYQQTLDFYKWVAAQVRAKGLKLVVENTVLPQESSSSDWPTSNFYAQLQGDFDAYKEARSEVAGTIAVELRPDYLVVASEPDTEASRTGQPLDTVSNQTDLVNDILAALSSQETSGLSLGAGIGTWQKDYDLYVDSLSRNTALDYIDMHVSFVNLDFLDRVLEVADIAASGNKKTTISETWLLKESESELSGGGSSLEYRSRDVFDFWALLDQKFLQALVDFASFEKLDYFSPSWSNSLYAYVQYDDQVKDLSPAELFALQSSQATDNLLAGQFSQTGLSYRDMGQVTNPVPLPVCGNSFCELGESTQFCSEDCVDIDYWSPVDFPKTSLDEKLAFGEMSPEERERYYSDQTASAQELSDEIEEYIRSWLRGEVPARIPRGLLPPTVENPKTHTWTLQRPEEVDPERQWYFVPARKEPATDGFQALYRGNAETHATYLKLLYIAPLNSKLRVEGDFPHSRQMSFHVSPPFDPEFPRSFYTGILDVPLLDVDIEPDAGHTNPFRPGADRAAGDRHYQVTFDLMAGNAYDLNPVLQDSHFRAPGNQRVGGPFESSGPWGQGTLLPAVLWLRYYGPDLNADGSVDPLAGVGLPKAELQLGSGEKFWIQPDLDLAQERQLTTTAGLDSPPVEPTEEFWNSSFGWLKGYGIFLSQFEAQAIQEQGLQAPDSVKQEVRQDFETLFNTGPRQPAPGNIGHSATDHAYNSYLSRPFALGSDKVYVITGKRPTTPATRQGETTMQPAQARYWSICHSVDQGEEGSIDFNGLVYGCLMDDEVQTDSANDYIIVYSRGTERPGNATGECGVNWQEFGPQSVQSFVIRWMSVYPDHYSQAYTPDNENIPWQVGTWSEPDYDENLLGRNQPGFMGPYHPIVHYLDREEFEGLGCALKVEDIPVWEEASKPPIRAQGAPTGMLPAETTEVTLALSTDESAICRFSQVQETPFEEMPYSFSLTGGTRHETLLTGLAGPAQYNYHVRCQDYEADTNLDDYTISFGVGVAPDTSPPTVPENLNAVAATDTEIQLGWDASSDDVGVTGYHVFRNGNPLATTLTPAYTDSLVQPMTEYTYQVSAWDAADNESAKSLPVTVNSGDTTPPTKPPFPDAAAVSDTRIDVTWQEPWDLIGVTDYQIYDGESGQLIAGTASTGYSDVGLGPWTTHSYFITALDGAGNESPPSRTVSARTTDSVAPTVPLAVTATAVAENQIDLGWDASTDNVKVVRYRIYRDGVLLASPTSEAYSDGRVHPGETYSYRVSAVDGAGNESEQSSPVLAEALDLTAPTSPLFLSATVVSDNQIDLNWNASRDTVGVAGYRIYDAESAQRVDETPSTSHSQTGLSPGTTYSYYVTAFDAAGNESAASKTVSRQTTDSVPPTVPQSLVATAVSDIEIRLVWEPSTDNVEVTGYEVYRNGRKIDTSTEPLYADTGLRPGKTYTYTVRAYDDARNKSDHSDPSSADTLESLDEKHY
ncbi:MAG: fibronectin type III domain-containing protein [Acidobacteriota bacterium]